MVGACLTLSLHYLDVHIERHLRTYGDVHWPQRLVHLGNSPVRLGLIRAKNAVALMATGSVIVFLDSHCEVNDNWLPPMLAVIAEDRKRCICRAVYLL